MFELEPVGGTTVLRLAHGKVNALDVELLDGLTGQLEQLADSDVRAVVVTGAGRAFCAGVDLFRVLDGGLSYADRLIPALSRAFHALFRFPKPIVAAVNGAAIAGGCIIACACDRRIVAADAPIGASELRVGVPFPAAALEILRYVTAERAEAVIFSGALYRGSDAAEHHLADELVPGEEVVARAVAVADDLATISPVAFRLAKERLRAPALERIVAGEAADDEVRHLWASAGTAAAIRASLERTVTKKA